MLLGCRLATRAREQQSRAREEQQQGRAARVQRQLSTGGGEVAATGARFVQHDLDPLAGLVVVHRFAVALAEGRGLDPDNPRSLTRSVILT